MLPIRTVQHISDTKAIRVLMGLLPENWLVRNVEERDYGVDLTLELFKKVTKKTKKGRKCTQIEVPKGQYVLLQVKGRQNIFNDSKNTQKLRQFEEKTIEYANLFNIPFFVVYVTLKDEKAHFLWLQEYTEQVLSNSNWKSKSKIDLDIPSENSFNTEDGLKKFELLVDRKYEENELFEIMKKFFELKPCVDGLNSGIYDIETVMDCFIEFLGFLEKQEYVNFYEEFNTEIAEPEDVDPDYIDFNELKNICLCAKSRKCINATDKQKLVDGMENTRMLIEGCLSEHDIVNFLYCY